MYFNHPQNCFDCNRWSSTKRRHFLTEWAASKKALGWVSPTENWWHLLPRMEAWNKHGCSKHSWQWRRTRLACFFILVHITFFPSGSSEARQLPGLYGIQQTEMHWPVTPHTCIWIRFWLTVLWDFAPPLTRIPSFWLYKSALRGTGWVDFSNFFHVYKHWDCRWQRLTLLICTACCWRDQSLARNQNDGERTDFKSEVELLFLAS